MCIGKNADAPGLQEDTMQGKKWEKTFFRGIIICLSLSTVLGVLWAIAQTTGDPVAIVITINGARSKDLVILEEEMKAVSDEAYVTTDDGSYGFHGFVTDKLQQLIDEGKTIDFVLAIGPIPMMKAVAEVTRPHAIRTVVSLNPIMVDGTGMCGGCRVIVDGKSKFACVDGPEFDAHLVDFAPIIGGAIYIARGGGETAPRFQRQYEFLLSAYHAAWITFNLYHILGPLVD